MLSAAPARYMVPAVPEISISSIATPHLSQVPVAKGPPREQFHHECPRLLVDIPEWIAVVKIRVVLADDSQQMIAMVRQTLCEECEVVGTAEDGKQAVDAVLALNPDAIVIDISMPVLNGLQAAEQLQMENCRAKVIFLTVHEGQDFVDAAFFAGASGYVNKARLSTDLIPAIQEAMLNRTFVSALPMQRDCPPST
jgi:CheY-like chemotaxis protein